MIQALKRTFALTESGTKGLLKASFYSALMPLAYILPMMIVMLFAQGVLEGGLQPMPFFIASIAIVVLIMYIILYAAYNAQYRETYNESANLRIEVANILKSLPLSYFSKHDISDLSQVILADVAAIEHAMSHAIPQSFGMALYLLIICSAMCAMNAKLTLCIIVPILVSFAMVLLSKKMQVLETGKYHQKLRKTSEAFQEAIELHQEIKSYGQAESVQQNLISEVRFDEKLHIPVEFVQAGPTTLSASVLSFMIGFTLLFGVPMLSNGEVSLLFLLGYIIAGAKIKDAVAALYMNLAEMMYIDARIKRIKELRQTKIQTGEKVELKNFDIEFKDVEFSYNAERKVIDGLSFVAKQNQVTALVGPSGCGKTSVLRLMSRLYDYDKGHIFIDGKEIDKIDTDSLFDKISIVFQEVSLFNTSVLENIRLGNKNADDEQVKQAARFAHCEEFISRLPQGYDTIIGENGSRLSGGERQRLSIARAFLKNAPIIILDEISASLDVENEMQIQQSLNSLIKGKTVVIISHRLKSVENVDKIIVMNNGKLDAEGTHAELLQKSALYRNMIEKSSATEKYRY
ncbi:ABC transporter ATP-binding protein [Treponema lecithinolyticum]|uniref:ABC transporter ATP-binding protein n=1 Tax=Treponema lecithinolyticum TaxID=53418 RepID=UPI0028E85634|nr:ABC transporter ATP-binding protein [Treponema lecithinolyticum]